MSLAQAGEDDLGDHPGHCGKISQKLLLHGAVPGMGGFMGVIGWQPPWCSHGT